MVYFLSFNLFPPLRSSSPEADDLAQYLDHLLAHAAPKKPQPAAPGGLSRFKAAASKTKDMVSLLNKAQGLGVHSEPREAERAQRLALQARLLTPLPFPQTSTCTCPTSCSARRSRSWTSTCRAPRRRRALGCVLQRGIYERVFNEYNSTSRDLQAPEAASSAGGGVPRDADGGVDHGALVRMLKDTQSLQAQADILYILFKDK